MKPAYIFIALTLLINGLLPVLEKTTLGKVDATKMIFLRAAAQMVIYAAYLLASGEFKGFAGIEPKYVAYGLLQGIGISAMLFFYFKAMMLEDASKVNTMAAAFPMVTYFFAILLLNEPLTFKRFIGIVLVIAGVLVIA
jgi:uncharacterized membrane protein